MNSTFTLGVSESKCCPNALGKKPNYSGRKQVRKMEKSIRKWHPLSLAVMISSLLQGRLDRETSSLCVVVATTTRPHILLVVTAATVSITATMADHEIHHVLAKLIPHRVPISSSPNLNLSCPSFENVTGTDSEPSLTAISLV